MTRSITTAALVLLLIALLGLACGGLNEEPTTEENTGRAESTAPETSPKESEEAEPTEEEDEPVEDGEPEEPVRPERIRFEKGMTEGMITLNLAPKAVKSFVVGVGPAQYFHVGVDDEQLDVSLSSRSRLSEITKGDSYVDGVTTSTGDIVFEIRNQTRSTIRSFARVTIKDRDSFDH